MSNECRLLVVVTQDVFVMKQKKNRPAKRIALIIFSFSTGGLWLIMLKERR